MRLVFALWSLLVGVYGDEVFEFYGDSHFEFGRQMGLRFRDKIQDRMRLTSKLQTLLLPFAKTSTGRKLLDRYLLTHRTTFPQYVEELEGVAEGSDVSFETIFIENIVEEFSNSIPPSFQSDVFPTEARHPVLRCSDIVLSSSEMHVVAHNEDSGEVDVNRTAIVIAKIADEPKFVAYTYLGDLPSGAFGFNQNGVAFTLNSKRVWNIEVASFNRHIVYEFKEEGNAISAFFHANQYQRLQIAQPPYQSSLHRLQRYNELTPPTTIDEALVVLGDQEDRSWPVFHDYLSHARGDLSGWTLTTIVFDLDKGKAVSFLGNPAHCRQNLVWDLSNVTVLSAAAN
ncbi:hypothetical protein JG688_00010374 [Phytophthora aleatoria]|uniref:Peptidase C45 hydrolase domain-containing protein n=1 Tax=Phytophthora aleatoria TaxID=2496075 RepID=A0A8J5MF47_9STRA|nr:hypothetical protein JG688_00010374 [Phytophthora aleatoria]